MLGVWSSTFETTATPPTAAATTTTATRYVPPDAATGEPGGVWRAQYPNGSSAVVRHVMDYTYVMLSLGVDAQQKQQEQQQQKKQQQQQQLQQPNGTADGRGTRGGNGSVGGGGGGGGGVGGGSNTSRSSSTTTTSAGGGGGFLPPHVAAEMSAFVARELLVPFWMRAQSLNDSAASASNRSDHGPSGAYVGWPALTVRAMGVQGG
jgi:hypothetical protein